MQKLFGTLTLCLALIAGPLRADPAIPVGMLILLGLSTSDGSNVDEMLAMREKCWIDMNGYFNVNRHVEGCTAWSQAMHAKGASPEKNCAEGMVLSGGHPACVPAS